MAKKISAERQEAIERVRGWLPKGSQVYCIIRKRSASGMSRNIQVLYFERNDDGTLSDRHPTYSIALAIGMTCKRDGDHDAIRVPGCGFDACEYLINEALSYQLYGETNCFKVRTI